MDFRSHEGFTLVEMLGVMALILILATVFVSNLFPSINKADDSKRKADVEQMGVGARLYYERYGSFPAYDQDIGVGNAIDSDLEQFIHVSTDKKSPDKNYHYNSNENCPLAGGTGKVVVYATLDDADGGNWQTICDSAGPADRYGIVVN